MGTLGLFFFKYFFSPPWQRKSPVLGLWVSAVFLVRLQLKSTFCWLFLEPAEDAVASRKATSSLRNPFLITHEMNYWEPALELAQPRSRGGFKIFSSIFGKWTFLFLTRMLLELLRKSAVSFNSEFRNLLVSLGPGRGWNGTLVLGESIFFVFSWSDFMNMEPAELSYCVYCLF